MRRRPEDLDGGAGGGEALPYAAISARESTPLPSVSMREKRSRTCRSQTPMAAKVIYTSSLRALAQERSSRVAYGSEQGRG